VCAFFEIESAVAKRVQSRGPQQSRRKLQTPPTRLTASATSSFCLCFGGLSIVASSRVGCINRVKRCLRDSHRRPPRAWRESSVGFGGLSIVTKQAWFTFTLEELQMFPKVQLAAFLLVMLVALAAADDASSVQSLRHSASVSNNGAASNGMIKPRELKMRNGNRFLKVTLAPVSTTVAPKKTRGPTMAPRSKKSKAPKGKKSKAPKSKAPKEKKSKAPKGKKSRTSKPRGTKAPRTFAPIVLR
jgi:hypothetical protein